MAVLRTDYLLDRLARVLRGMERTGFSPDDILDALTEAQKELARRGHALKARTEITTQRGTALYNLSGLITVTALFRPARWREELTIVETDVIWADVLSREFQNDYPLYARGYSETVELYPAPSISGEKVSLDYAHWPRAPRLLPGTDPEVSPVWDSALKMGALAELLGGEYEENFTRAISAAKAEHERTLSAGVNQRDHFSRTLGW